MTTTDVDLVSGEIVPLNSSTLDLNFAHSPAQTREWMRMLQEYRRAILVDGSDFAVIPGTEKPSLLKPGAEKLLLAAGLGFTILKIDDDDSRTHRGVSYRCTIRRGAQIVAECDGYAGLDESRFYVSASEAEARERANATKYQRKPNEAKFVEYKAPWNSIIKMAQKRAMVGATLNALAASGLFTQDMEDVVAGQAPAFDAPSLMKPYLARLDRDQLSELKVWRQANDLPSPSQMSAEQAAMALVEIGRLLAFGEPEPSDSAQDSDGVPFDQPEADETAQDAPLPPEAAPAVSQEPETGREAMSALAAGFPTSGSSDIPVPADNGYRDTLEASFAVGGADAIHDIIAHLRPGEVAKALQERGVPEPGGSAKGMRALLGATVIRNGLADLPTESSSGE